MANIKGQVNAGKVLVKPFPGRGKNSKRNYYPRFSQGKTTAR